MQDIQADGVSLTPNEYKLYKNFWSLQKLIVHPRSIFDTQGNLDIEDYAEEDSEMSFCEDETNPSGEKTGTKTKLKENSDRESGAIAEDEFMEPGVLDGAADDTYIQA